MQATVASPATAQRIIEFDQAEFRENFNKRWFAFEHTLANHPLFELDRLIVLANQTARERPHNLHFDRGATEIGQRWNQTPSCDWPVDETIRRLQNAGAWIVLKRAEKDPDYKAVIDRAIGEVLELTGPQLQKQMAESEVILFITSPNRLSTYHIDRECNFLAQIRGEKTIHVFDKYDREVTPEKELERFWSVDNNAAQYKKELQYRADTFVLRPGNGLHIPVNAPHWLQNHNNISISASLNFQFKDSLLGDIYRANYLLRKLGLNPVPPGKSPARDRMKRALFGTGMAIADATPNSIRDGVKKVLR